MRQPSFLTGTILCFAQATSTPAVCTEMLSCHLRFCSTLSCLRLPQKSKTTSFDAWYRMLEVSITYGKTYIITNAAQGWVEFSAEKFMPSVVPILSKINIISARARYESQYPTDVPMWKMNTFLETQGDLTDGNIKNLIAIGDSMLEMDAAH